MAADVTFDWTVILSVAAFAISVVSLWLSVRTGRIWLFGPTFIGLSYAQHADVAFVLPIAAENTGTNPKAAKLLLVLDEKVQCSHIASLDKLTVDVHAASGLPGLPGAREPSPLVIGPKSAAYSLAAFSLDLLQQSSGSEQLSRAEPHTLDLWYQESTGWRFGLRVYLHPEALPLNPAIPVGVMYTTKHFVVSRDPPRSRPPADS